MPSAERHHWLWLTVHPFARGRLVAILTGHRLRVLEPSASARAVLMKVLKWNPGLEYLDLSCTDGTHRRYCTVAAFMLWWFMTGCNG